MSTASEAFDQLPYEPLVPVHPFEVAISDHVWHELIILLSRSKLAPRTYEALQGRKYGVPYDWLVKARMIWLRDFDWYAAPRLLLPLLRCKPGPSMKPT